MRLTRLIPLLFVLLLACAPAAALAQDDAATGATGPDVVEPDAGAVAPSDGTATDPTATTGLPPASETTQPADTATTGATGPTKPPSDSSSDDNGLTGLAIAAIVLAAIILAAILVWLVHRWRGWDPRWLKRWRHATAEAGWRLSLSWAEFRDFVRIGR